MYIVREKLLWSITVLLLGLLPLETAAQDTPLPYYCTFESNADTVLGKCHRQGERQMLICLKEWRDDGQLQRVYRL